MADKKFFGAAQELRIKLSDMIDAGRPPLEIVLTLAKLVGEISGEDSYYQTTREQILAVYGFALKEKFILEDELAEVKARLEKISAAYESTEFTEEEHIRIGYALEAHKKEIARLEKQLGIRN
ncbi:MAG: hypothetical protein IJG80_02445 [Selenomonadaceae bacterium]|nr:hypothetical protein [Selenomonadaceae bacterium]MBQ3727588.1 hypothetical protein [Selenomonadaceae bacterium]MBQ9497654.1 hypothetical protein [Selenomonadaceae bacterium]